jgi:hypothetical protein
MQKLLMLPSGGIVLKRSPLLLLLLLGTSSVRAADDAALLRCRAVADAAARMACYDAIPLAQQGAAATAAVTTSAAAATPAPAAVPQSAAAKREADIAAFGAAQGEPALRAKDKPLQSYDTTIAGRFDGWEPNQTIKLANGQAWRVVDGSIGTMRAAVNPKVTVRKGLLGAIFLDIDGAYQSPKVIRVQ